MKIIYPFVRNECREGSGRLEDDLLNAGYKSLDYLKEAQYFSRKAVLQLF